MMSQNFSVEFRMVPYTSPNLVLFYTICRHRLIYIPHKKQGILVIARMGILLEQD